MYNWETNTHMYVYININLKDTYPSYLEKKLESDRRDECQVGDVEIYRTMQETLS